MPADGREFAEQLRAHMSHMDAQQEQARIAYEALSKTGQLRNYRLVTYRCAARRCLLLDVVNMPQPVGLVFHQPRYKNSPELNQQTSSEAGRRANTEDGNRRWRPRTYPAGYCINVTMSCDHVTLKKLDKGEIEADIKARRDSVLVTA